MGDDDVFSGDFEPQYLSKKAGGPPESAIAVNANADTGNTILDYLNTGLNIYRQVKDIRDQPVAIGDNGQPYTPGMLGDDAYAQPQLGLSAGVSPMLLLAGVAIVALLIWRRG